MLPVEHKDIIQKNAKQFDDDYKLWLKAHGVAKKSKSIFLISILFGGVYAGGFFNSIESVEHLIKACSAVVFVCGILSWLYYRSKANQCEARYSHIAQMIEAKLGLYMTDNGRVYTLDVDGNINESFDAYNDASYQ